MTQDDSRVGIRVSAAGQVKPQDRLGSRSVLRQGPAPYPLPAQGHRVACRTPPDLSPCWPPGLSPPGLLGHLLAGLKLLGNEPRGRCGALQGAWERAGQGSPVPSLVKPAVQMGIRWEPALDSLGLVIKGSLQGKHQALPFKAVPAN